MNLGPRVCWLGFGLSESGPGAGYGVLVSCDLCACVVGLDGQGICVWPGRRLAIGPLMVGSSSPLNHAISGRVHSAALAPNCLLPLPTPAPTQPPTPPPTALTRPTSRQHAVPQPSPRAARNSTMAARLPRSRHVRQPPVGQVATAWMTTDRQAFQSLHPSRARDHDGCSKQGTLDPGKPSKMNRTRCWLVRRTCRQASQGDLPRSGLAGGLD